MNEQLLEKPATLRNRRWGVEKPAEALKNGTAIRKEQLFDLVLEQVPDGIAVCDRSGRIIYASKALCKLSSGNPLARTFDQTFHLSLSLPDKKNQPFSTTIPISGRVIRDTDGLLRCREGKIRPLLVNASPLKDENNDICGCLIILKDVTPGKEAAANTVCRDQDRQVQGVAGLARDLTKRQRAEDKLRKQEGELRTLIDHLPDIISRFDRDLRCIFVSPQVADVFDVAEEKCLGKTVRETGLFNEGMLNLFKSRSHRVFESGRPETFEFTYAGPAEARCFSTRFIPEFDGGGNIASLLSIMQDITERKQVEMELQNRTAQLENLNRELESFSYSVSHDLKAPLRTIDGYSRMLLRKHSARLDEDARDMLQVIRTHAGMMGQLIDDLLAFSRVTRKDMNISEINMELLASDVWKEMAATAGEREIEIRIANMPSGFGDPSLVRQVLTNLLANAMKFTRDRKPGIIETGSSIVNNEVIYYVRDNGVGFDMKYYEKLFGVFQRLHGDNEFEGTGVGLAIVQRIINRLGGRVWAEGKRNGGAIFYFTLPGTKP